MGTTRRSFEEEWPSLADFLKRALVRKYVTSWQADDIVQETGLRLFKMWDEVDFLRSPRGLALTIAGNLLWDERNRRAAREILGMVPERPCDADVERAGIARFELGRVRRAMTSLSPQHRSVLLAEIGNDAAPEGSPAAIKMLRMRARRRLNSILETASASGLAALGLRQRAWRAFSFVRRHASFSEAPVAAMAAVCGAVALLILPGEAIPAPRAGAIERNAMIPASVQAAAEISALDAESRLAEAPAPAVAKRGPRPTAPRTRGAEDEGQSYVLYVGDDEGPVSGGATVTLVPDHDGFEIPTCSAEPGEMEVNVDCEAEANDQEIKAKAKLGVRP